MTTQTNPTPHTLTAGPIWIVWTGGEIRSTLEADAPATVLGATPSGDVLVEVEVDGDLLEVRAPASRLRRPAPVLTPQESAARLCQEEAIWAAWRSGQISATQRQEELAQLRRAPGAPAPTPTRPTTPPAPAPAPAQVIPAERLEAKRAEVEARREVVEAAEGDDDCDPAPMLEAVGVVEVSPGLWHVSSDRDPARGYLVTVRDGAATHCDCPDRAHRRRVCKHMRAVGLVPLALDGAALLLERGHALEAITRDLGRYAQRDGRESALARLGAVAGRQSQKETAR